MMHHMPDCCTILYSYIVIVFHTMSFTSYQVEQLYLQSEFKEHLLPIVNTISYNCVVAIILYSSMIWRMHGIMKSLLYTSLIAPVYKEKGHYIGKNP